MKKKYIILSGVFKNSPFNGIEYDTFEEANKYARNDVDRVLDVNTYNEDEFKEMKSQRTIARRIEADRILYDEEIKSYLK